MSKLLIFLLSLTLLLACHTAQKAQNPATAATPTSMAVKPKTDNPLVSWDKKLVDLGSVKKGEKRSMHFEFTNTSGVDVQLEGVSACDCTTVDYPRGVIPPNGKGKLDVVFDSKDKDESEKIDIDLIFKNTDAAGNPRIERVSYTFVLVK